MLEKLKKIAEELAELATEQVFPREILGDGINDVNLAPNFRLAEFQCKHCGAVKIDPELVRRLQTMREEIGKPIIINSGYRCPTHNKAVGGASNSQHLYGRAADIVCPGLTTAQLYTVAEKYFADGGLGRYAGYVHVDVRGTKARWTG